MSFAKTGKQVRLSQEAYRKVKTLAEADDITTAEAADRLVRQSAVLKGKSKAAVEATVKGWAADVLDILEREAARTGVDVDTVCQDYIRRAQRRKDSLDKYHVENVKGQAVKKPTKMPEYCEMSLEERRADALARAAARSGE